VADEQRRMIITCVCGQKMKVPATAMGKTFKCVRCAKHVRVTQDNAHVAGEPPGPQKTEPTPELPPARELIGELLLEEGLITRDQLNEALGLQQRQGGKTFELLISLGHLSKDDLHEFLSRQPGVATIDLSRVTIDRKIVELVPKKIALESLVLPIDRLGKLLTVAMACPLDEGTIAQLQQRTGLKVKAMLCKLNDIHAAVKRYYPIEGKAEALSTFELPPEMAGAPKEELRPRVNSLEHLGLPPGTLDQMKALAEDPAATVRDVAELAAADPALAATLLTMANSAAYGLAGHVDSVPMAVGLLGKDGTVAAVMQSAASKVPSAPDQRRLLERSRRCAALAGSLAEASGRVGPAVAATAGLLHQLGCFAIAALAPAKYQRIDPALAGAALLQAEKHFFTLGHPEAGSHLAARWRWPDSLHQALLHYLTPEKADPMQELASVVAVAASAAAQDGPIDAAALEDSRKALECLGLDINTTLAAIQRAAAAWQPKEEASE